MNLDTLIQELEKADGLATGGEWSVTGAQAIIIRHETAGDVLRELKAQRARADVPALLDEVERLRKLADDLYYSLRMSEDVGVEESFFEEDERATGPDGLYLELEARWLERTPDYVATTTTSEDPTP